MVIRLIWLYIGLPGSAVLFKWELLGFRLSTGAFMYRDIYDYTGPLAAGTFRWITTLFGTSFWPHFILSTFLVIFQAGYLNIVLLRIKAFDENNYLPAFLYVIVQSSLPEFYVLSPQLLGLTFLILALNLVFRRIDNMASDELFLLAGIFVGLAMLFYLPTIAFFISFLLSFVLFSTAILRRVILFIMGMLTVVMLVWAYTYWFGYHTDFLISFFVDGFAKPKTYFLATNRFFETGYAVLFFFAISIVGILWYRRSNFQTKIVQVMLFFLLAGVVSFFISPELSGTEYVFLLPPMSFLLSHLLLNLRRKVLRLTVPYVVVFGLLGYPFLVEREELIQYQVEDEEKVMLIGDQYALYQGHRITSPFLDEYVSRRRMEGLDYYLPATVIYSTLLKDDPDRIIDQWGYWDEIAYRFPEFANRYQRVAAGVYTKISN